MALKLGTLTDLIVGLECDPLRYPLRRRLALFKAGAWRPGQPFRPFSKAFVAVPLDDIDVSRCWWRKRPAP